MPSDFAPISTTTCVAVSFSTVPLMTRSSLTASSASVVKVSSAEAKSSLDDDASDDSLPAADWVVSGNCCSVVGSASVTTVEVESEWGSVVSSNKVMPL